MKTALNKIREVNRYIKDHYFKLTVVLFCIYSFTTILSYLVVISLPSEDMGGITEKLFEIFNEDNIMEKQGFHLFWSIFVHNLRACGISIVSAITPFLFFPLQHVVWNGILSGMVYGVGNYMGAENMFLSYLKYVLPHAIFEIPISMLSCAIGLRLCFIIMKKIFGKAENQSFKYHFKKLSEILIIYIVPFLLIAAFIEGVLEPLIFGM